MKFTKYSRRKFIEKGALAGVGSALSMGIAPSLLAKQLNGAPPLNSEPIIDIHQHSDFRGRNNRQLVGHQRAMELPPQFYCLPGDL